MRNGVVSRMPASRDRFRNPYVRFSFFYLEYLLKNKKNSNNVYMNGQDIPLGESVLSLFLICLPFDWFSFCLDSVSMFCNDFSKISTFSHNKSSSSNSQRVFSKSSSLCTAVSVDFLPFFLPFDGVFVFCSGGDSSFGFSTTLLWFMGAFLNFSKIFTGFNFGGDSLSFLDGDFFLGDCLFGFGSSSVLVVFRLVLFGFFLASGVSSTIFSSSESSKGRVGFVLLPCFDCVVK